MKGKGKLLKTAVASSIIGTTLLTGCNMRLFDTKYGFDKALIMGDDTAIILDVENWKDYSGEQIQIVTKDGLAILTSSFDTNLASGNSDIDKIAQNCITAEGEVKDLSIETGESLYNKDVIDTKYMFNKAITFNKNKALVLPVRRWKDYSGKQIQVISNDGLVLNLSSYNSKLIDDRNSFVSASDIAKYYVRSDGLVTDLALSYDDTNFNYDIIDTEYYFNKAIIMKDNTAVVLSIDSWCDYEGEQLQLNITNGPTMLSAAYDTILINDINSKTKAKDIAKCLSDKVVDLTSSKSNYNGMYNCTIVDFNYGYSNAIISSSNASAILKIDLWCDYEGEQLQIKLSNGDVILTSSMLLDLVNGGNDNINASIIGSSYVLDGCVTDNSNNDIYQKTYNKYLIDAEVKFNYALKIVDGNVTIIPINKWRDYTNSDGDEYSSDSPNCEQLQLVLPDNTILLTTAYNTVLVKTNDIETVAKYFVGEEGIINDLTSYVGSPEASGWNFQLFDTYYSYTHAIMINGKTSQIFNINKWRDYADGEQLQIEFDGQVVLTSYVNTTLILPNTKGIEEIIAASFTGELNKNKTLVKEYK